MKEGARHGGPAVAASAGAEVYGCFQCLIHKILYTKSYSMSRESCESFATIEAGWGVEERRISARGYPAAKSPPSKPRGWGTHFSSPRGELQRWYSLAMALHEEDEEFEIEGRAARPSE